MSRCSCSACYPGHREPWLWEPGRDHEPLAQPAEARQKGDSSRVRSQGPWEPLGRVPRLAWPVVTGIPKPLRLALALQGIKKPRASRGTVRSDGAIPRAVRWAGGAPGSRQWPTEMAAGWCLARIWGTTRQEELEAGGGSVVSRPSAQPTTFLSPQPHPARTQTWTTCQRASLPAGLLKGEGPGLVAPWGPGRWAPLSPCTALAGVATGKQPPKWMPALRSWAPSPMGA